MHSFILSFLFYFVNCCSNQDQISSRGVYFLEQSFPPHSNKICLYGAQKFAAFEKLNDFQGEIINFWVSIKKK